ncbi:hypothetical protein [Xenorhabdus bovienii]|uniref:hypothetical protein n=1 Tax=Xenorhabdus bovienii TaxID=40576 RepID=UPI0023B277BE|nr:hypothetical protein [Xenorhabdus bovienii]MDE1486438.1 hypothetical protein [Xenorhabdus bovienii]
MTVYCLTYLLGVICRVLRGTENRNKASLLFMRSSCFSRTVQIPDGMTITLLHPTPAIR